MAGASLFASCNSLCGIGVYMRAIGCGIGASLWLGGSPHPRRWAKRKGHLRFPFLFGLLPFPWIVWRRLPTCDRCERGNGRGFFLPCLSQPIRSVRYRSATQVGYFQQAQHTRVAQFVCTLLCMAPANISLQTHFILQVLHSQRSTLHSNSQFSIFNSQLFTSRTNQTDWRIHSCRSRH